KTALRGSLLIYFDKVNPHKLISASCQEKCSDLDSAMYNIILAFTNHPYIIFHEKQSKDIIPFAPG
ncbi:5753_t:CDS:2, partial [Gigaspora rosea]